MGDHNLEIVSSEPTGGGRPEGSVVDLLFFFTAAAPPPIRFIFSFISFCYVQVARPSLFIHCPLHRIQQHLTFFAGIALQQLPPTPTAAAAVIFYNINKILERLFIPSLATS